MDKRMYLSIDLKSFYASVECLEHGLDPMMILSILVDTFLSRISLTMLPAPNLHNISCVLS